MSINKTVRTDRLILRPWREEDLGPLTRLNTNLRVMEFMPSPLTREESTARLEVYTKHIQDHG